MGSLHEQVQVDTKNGDVHLNLRGVFDLCGGIRDD
jgi:hypothetical protein